MRPRPSFRLSCLASLPAAVLLPVVLLAAVLLAVACPPAPAGAETLADAVALAYANSPVLNEQRFRLKTLDEQYVQSRGQYGPQLSLQASGGYAYTRAAGTSIDNDSGQFAVTLSQPLYTSGRLRGELASRRAAVRAGQEQLRSTEQQTVQDVVIVYAQVKRDEARLAVGRENVAVLQEQLRENRARRRVGDITLTDVGQSDARLAAAEIQLAGLEAQLAVSRGQYLQVVGRNPGTLAPLPDVAGLPPSIEEAFRRAEEANPDLSVARFSERASAAAAASVRGERGPSVSVSAQGIYSNELFSFDGRSGQKRATAGFTVTQPLFAAGAISSRIRQADANNSADQVAIDQARRLALQSVTAAWSQLSAARVALVSGERQVASAQLAFAGMQREQRYGLRSTIDTLNAEQELQSAQLNFLQSRYQEYVSRTALLAATGTLRAAVLSPAVDSYDPEVNFRRVRNRGMTPFEPIAMGLDRLGSASPRRPVSANLAGEGIPVPATAPPLPPQPGPALTDAPLTPITRSRLVPASELPGGMPLGATLPDRPADRPADPPLEADPAPRRPTLSGSPPAGPK